MFSFDYCRYWLCAICVACWKDGFLLLEFFQVECRRYCIFTWKCGRHLLLSANTPPGIGRMCKVSPGRKRRAESKQTDSYSISLKWQSLIQEVLHCIIRVANIIWQIFFLWGECSEIIAHLWRHLLAEIWTSQLPAHSLKRGTVWCVNECPECFSVWFADFQKTSKKWEDASRAWCPSSDLCTSPIVLTTLRLSTF